MTDSTALERATLRQNLYAEIKGWLFEELVATFRSRQQRSDVLHDPFVTVAMRREESSTCGALKLRSIVEEFFNQLPTVIVHRPSRGPATPWRTPNRALP